MASSFGPRDLPQNTTTTTHSFMDGKIPLNVVIVGGSHSALFIAILLKRQGHNIRILESATSSARSGLAAGIGLAAWVKRFFDENDRLKDIPFGTPNDFLHILNPTDVTVKEEIPMYFRMTTWDATYYRLRANFDGMESSYCPHPRALEEGEGEGVYETGRRVLRVDELPEGAGVKLLTEDVESGDQHTFEADVVIAADGANSSIRPQLNPDLRREESGYVLWRGTVPTKDLSEEILFKLEGNTSLCQMPYSYTVIYTIPGANGSLEPGEQHMNFAWYTWPSQSALTVKDILTDTEGHTHRTTLPKGKMRPEIWSTRVLHAKKTLPPLLYELASKISDPFVSLITTVSAPRAAYFHNRLFLIGDAMTQLQPNTGQGTNMAAMDAMLLGRVFSREISATEWEVQVLETSWMEQRRAVVFASRRLCGWWWVGRWVGVWRWWRGGEGQV